MRARVLIDDGQGRVYRVPCRTLTEARRIARGVYYTRNRCVVESESVVELYEAGRAPRSAPAVIERLGGER